MSRTGSIDRVQARYERAGIYGHNALGRETEWRAVLRNPKYNDMRLLCEDLVRHGRVLPETWQYVDAQYLSLLAERLRTQHVKPLSGTYDADRDLIVAAVAGGEELTFEAITATGLDQVRKAAGADRRLGWQVTRDQVYADNYNGPIKDLVRSDSDDVLMYVSTCPTDMDLPEDQDPQGMRNLAKDLFYDFEDHTWYMYFAQATNGENGERILTMYNIRMAGSDDQIIRDRLVQWGADPEAVQAASLHELGKFVGRAATDGLSAMDFIDTEVAWYDMAVEAKTGQSVSYGRAEESIEAYKLFAAYPELQQASRTYHELLARHIVGDLIDPQLKTYLLGSLEAQEQALKTRHSDIDTRPVISMADIYTLRDQIRRGRIQVDMFAPCQDMMMYSHTALFDEMLRRYNNTGEIVPLGEGKTAMGAYSDAASVSGGEATYNGTDYDDCPGTVSTSRETTGAADAAALAAELGISLEEAYRRLNARKKVAHGASLVEKYGAENVRYGIACGNCDVTRKGGVGPCGPGFCNECDTMDRIKPGFIARGMARKAKELALVA